MAADRSPIAKASRPSSARYLNSDILKSIMKRLHIQVSPPKPERESPQPSFSQPGTTRRLPEGVREKMEGLFGTDFSNVRVQVGPQAPSLGALAFTRGSNLHFAPGQYDPT